MTAACPASRASHTDFRGRMEGGEEGRPGEKWNWQILCVQAFVKIARQLTNLLGYLEKSRTNTLETKKIGQGDDFKSCRKSNPEETIKSHPKIQKMRKNHYLNICPTLGTHSPAGLNTKAMTSKRIATNRAATRRCTKKETDGENTVSSPWVVA